MSSVGMLGRAERSQHAIGRLRRAGTRRGDQPQGGVWTRSDGEVCVGFRLGPQADYDLEEARRALGKAVERIERIAA